MDESTGTLKQLQKILFLGNQGVGKTSIRKKYLGYSFDDDYKETIGLNITTKEFDNISPTVVVAFWDVGWQQQYRILRNSIFLGTSSIILVFDVTQPFDFENNILPWVEDFRTALETDFSLSSIPIIILGNKVDLVSHRKSSLDDGQSTVDHIKRIIGNDMIKYFDTSAKEGTGVIEAIDWLIRAGSTKEI